MFNCNQLQQQQLTLARVFSTAFVAGAEHDVRIDRELRSLVGVHALLRGTDRNVNLAQELGGLSSES